MQREETVKIIRIIVESYPNYKVRDLSETVNIWNMMLSDYTYQQVSVALKKYILTETSGFAPSIGQIVDKIHSSDDANDLSENEAWSIVYKAICRSGYNSTEEFEKLPQILKRAVGSPANLKEWSQMDSDTVLSVEQSHFIRSYRSALIQVKENNKINNCSIGIENFEHEKLGVSSEINE